MKTHLFFGHNAKLKTLGHTWARGSLLRYLCNGGLLVHARDQGHDLSEGAIGGSEPGSLALHQSLPLPETGRGLLETAWGREEKI